MFGDGHDADEGEAGLIKKLYLENFMCHKQFTVGRRRMAAPPSPALGAQAAGSFLLQSHATLRAASAGIPAMSRQSPF